MGYRILVVEDEDNIRTLIALNLEISGFKVFEADSGEKGLEICNEEQIELVVLDVMLPGIDGYEVCRRLRESKKNICIIMLTAKGQDMDKIIGLDLGADDYMVKPFNPMELVSRIRAVLRRIYREENSNIKEFGHFKVDYDSHKVYKNGEEISLTHREYSLLKCFIDNPDVAFTRDEILNNAWGERYYGEIKTVDVHVRRLREKLEDDPSKPKIIQTVWGHGYRFVRVK